MVVVLIVREVMAVMSVVSAESCRRGAKSAVGGFCRLAIGGHRRGELNVYVVTPRVC